MNITASLKLNIKKVCYILNKKTKDSLIIQIILIKVHRTADFSIPEISNKIPKAEFKVLPEDLIKNSMKLNLK